MPGKRELAPFFVPFVTAYVPYIGAVVAGAFAVLVALGAQGTGVAVAMLVVVVLVEVVVVLVVVLVVPGDPPPPPDPPPPEPLPPTPLAGRKVHAALTQSGGAWATTTKTFGSASSSLTLRGCPDIRQPAAGSLVEKPVRGPTGWLAPCAGREPSTTGARATDSPFHTPE